MNILMVASEAIPFARTGDVANVVTGLAAELRRKGHDVRLALPHYRELVAGDTAISLISDLDVKLASYTRKATIKRLDHKFDAVRLPVYLIGEPYYFGRDRFYGYLDDYERFIFFGRGVLAMLCHPDFEKEAWQPDVIHGHDWIAGLIPTWLREAVEQDRAACSPASIFTIHNTGYQGCFGYRALHVAGLAGRGIYPAIGEHTERINFAARGVLAADVSNTVSPTHATEISAGDYAPELRRAVQTRGGTLRGILNSLSFRDYNPALDDSIPRRFDQYNLDLRAENKSALQAACGFATDPATPLVSFVSRLIAEKGTGLLESIVPALLKEGVQLIVSGEPDDELYREVFSDLMVRHPQQVHAIFGTDDVRTRRICAGADIILVPSLIESCGLQQMIAMRYGAVPVVHRTGGLADTVLSFDDNIAPSAETSADAKTQAGRGFIFEAFNAPSFLTAAQAALALYRDPGRRAIWDDLQRQNMQVDFSWGPSAMEYQELYREALQTRQTRHSLPEGVPATPNAHEQLLSTVLEVDELAMSSSPDDHLLQAARSVRDLFKADGVMIWCCDRFAPLRLRPEVLTLAAGGGMDKLRAYLSASQELPQQFSRSTQHTYYLAAESALSQTRLGFLNSQLARSEGWQAQLSAPLSTQGSILGQIDVFTSNPERRFDDPEVSALTALARTLAANLEKGRLRQQRDRLLTADREMAHATQLDQIAQSVLSCARDLTGAVAVRVALKEDQAYTLDERGILTAERSGPGAAITFLPQRLITTAGHELGRIEAAKPMPGSFSREDESALADLAAQAADALGAACDREARDHMRVDRLRQLADSVLGGGDYHELLNRIVSAAASVLDVGGASLYLLDETETKLTIQTAVGQEAPLFNAHAEYALGEGITGGIALEGKTVKADSSTALRRQLHWAGKYTGSDRPSPETFLGIPLTVFDRITGARRVIGVLKLVNKQPHEFRSPVFDDEDLHLGEMIANLLATIIYHHQISQTRLEKLSRDLSTLSSVLAGGREMHDLLSLAVSTMMKVLGAEAAALFLVDEPMNSVVVEAAAGYQAGLLSERASYRMGEGLTGWIAQEGKSFRADTLAELHAHPAWLGKHNQHLGKEPNAFLGLPLLAKDRFSDKDIVIGVLKVENIAQTEHHPEPHFTAQDELLVTMMANVIATVLNNTQVSQRRLEKLGNDLSALSGALAGGREMGDVLDQVVETIMRVLSAEASSLFLVDDATGKVVVKAAAGYQKPLVEAEAAYKMGEGITGWIAKEGRPVRANSWEELHRHPAWKGIHTRTYGGREPNSFLGLPLLVTDRYDQRNKVIGVLKIENIARSFSHPEPYFTDQDELLVAAMANVIATVLYRTQVSQLQLEELSHDLAELSAALAGGREMRDLLDRVVETIRQVLGAEASALFLVDEATNTVVIQAAAGYQRPLVTHRASYKSGEGITGWIAKEGRAVRARTRQELHTHPAWRGVYTSIQDGREPNSFLGLPLRVHDRATNQDKIIGVLKVENVARAANHPASYFTDQDELLVTMMANVIATVIYSVRQGESRVGDIFRSMGTLSHPVKSARDILCEYVQSEDLGILDQLAIATATALDRRPQASEEEIQALLKEGAKPELYRRIASRAQSEGVRWLFSLLSDTLALTSRPENWAQVKQALRPWLQLHDNIDEPTAFAAATHNLVGQVAAAIHTNSAAANSPFANRMFAGAVLDVKQTLGDAIDRIPLVFQRTGVIDQDAVERLYTFTQNEMDRPYQVIVLVTWRRQLTPEQVEHLKRWMQARAVDLILLDPVQLIQIMQAASPEDELRGIILRQATLLSPFMIVGPVPPSMFFGRERELRSITDYLGAGRSCAVIGGRRYGKTSVLLRLHGKLLPDLGFRTLYLDWQAFESHDDIMQARTLDWRPAPPVIAPATLGELLRNPPADKRLVLLIDEVDRFIAADREADWRFFRMLRGLATDGKIRVVLSGERVLREALAESSGPLFNFVNVRSLGPLERDAVEQLVMQPLTQFGFEIENKAEVVRRICDFTSNHPNVVQRLCHRLLDLSEARSTHRITPIEIDTVLDDPAYQEEDFLATYWERATPIERIITLLMAEEDRGYRLRNVLDLLVAHGVSAPPVTVKAALDRLVNLRCILKHGRAGWEFAVKAFPRVVANTATASDLLIVLRDEYEQEKE